MFKKLVKIGGQNQLSGKDRKMLKAELVKQLGEPEVEHFFATHEKIICQKVSGTKTLIYVTDDYPVFVDGTGKSEFFPTLYAMAAYPNFLPSLTICEGVETFIIGGANLMWPGVADYSRLGDFKKDELVAVKSSKGEFVAIAALAVSSKELSDETRKGTACYVLHYINDKLWEHGPKIAPKVEFEREVKEEIKKPEEPKKIEKPEQPKIEVKEPGAEDKQVQKPKDKKDKKKKGQKKEQEPAAVEPPKEVKKVEVNKPAEVVKKVEAVKPESESQEEEELTTLLHNKKGNQAKQPTKKIVEDKVENKFQDDSDDDKKKKKKRPQKKKEEEPVEVQKKPVKGKAARKESSDEQQQVKKPAPKKKGKKQESDSEEEEVQEKKPKKGKKKDEQEQVHDSKETEEKSSLAPHIMDEQFKEALLNALKLAVDDNELPIDSGMFYTEYILPARREGVTLDIKQSSFKKMNKFYESMDRLGLIEFKQGKQKNGAVGSMITKVHRDNETLSEHIPTIKKLAVKGQEPSEQEKEEKADPKLKFKMSSSVQVKQVYRLVTYGQKKHGKGHEGKEQEKEKQKEPLEENPLEFLFPRKPKQQPEKKEKGKDRKIVFDPEEYFTEEQVKDKLNNYITQLEEQSAKKNEPKQEEEAAKPKKDKKDRPEEQDKKKKYIYINYSQDPNIQKLLKDEIQVHEHFLKLEAEKPVAEEEGEEKEVEKEKSKKKKDRGEHNKHLLKITREELEHRAMQFLEPFHQLSDKENGLMEFRPGKFSGIHVSAEKSNNKNITTLSGFELFLVPKDKVNQQTTNFISLLQQKFNSNVSAHNLQRKAGGKELSIQGHFLDEVVALLVDDFKIRKEYITTTNKLDKKKKN